MKSSLIKFQAYFLERAKVGINDRITKKRKLMKANLKLNSCLLQVFKAYLVTLKE